MKNVLAKNKEKNKNNIVGYHAKYHAKVRWYSIFFAYGPKRNDDEKATLLIMIASTGYCTSIPVSDLVQYQYLVSYMPGTCV